MDGTVPAAAAIAAQPPEMLMEKQTKGHVREMMMVNGDGDDDSWYVSGEEGWAGRKGNKKSEMGETVWPLQHDSRGRGENMHMVPIMLPVGSP